MFHSFFSSAEQGRGIYPSFHILSLLFCGQSGQQSQQFCKFSSFCWSLLLKFSASYGSKCVRNMSPHGWKNYWIEA